MQSGCQLLLHTQQLKVQLDLAEQASTPHLQVPLAHDCRYNNQQHTCQDHQGCIVLGKAYDSPFTLGLLTHSLQHTHSTGGICFVAPHPNNEHSWVEALQLL